MLETTRPLSHEISWYRDNLFALQSCPTLFRIFLFRYLSYTLKPIVIQQKTKMYKI